MVMFYYYNDLKDFKHSIHNVKSNLCSMYYPDKKRFCGNYCSRKINKFNKRCWRHPKPNLGLEAVVLLMISASERFFNRDRWLKFLLRTEEQNVPLHLVIYHEDMENTTVRHPQNFLSRFRPFPDMFPGKVLPLRNSHGSLNYAQVNLKMLEYGLKIPDASRCIVITERTIPIRSPKRIYKTCMRLKCHADISYNVRYGPVPNGLPIGHRGNPFAAANNHAQGMFTVEFLKRALPTVEQYYQSFGFNRNRDGVYVIRDQDLFEQWRRFTGSNPSEFWLINSFLLFLTETTSRPMSELGHYMEKTIENDKYTVAEIPQWRDGWKRTFVFRDQERKEKIEVFDRRSQQYYRGLSFEHGLCLRDVIRFLRRNKNRAMFFRQVEMP